jgi:hypothetical protein
MIRTLAIFHASVFTVFILSGCAQPMRLSSRWRNIDIEIGDVGSDWGRAAMYVPKAKIAVTMINDSEFLYIRLSSRDREMQAQVMTMGLTLWFDAGGGKNKITGVHFPLGMQSRHKPPVYEGIGRGPKGMNMEDALRGVMNELEIIGPGKDENRTMSQSVAASHGLDVSLGMLHGNMIYEMKIPLALNDKHQIAVGLNQNSADTTRKIGIGFETPEFDMSGFKKRPGSEGEPPDGMEPDEGSGVPSGGMEGIHRGGPPGGAKTARLDIWTVVKLATLPPESR